MSRENRFDCNGFFGEWPFRRTTNRHDFSLIPPRTMLNAISEQGQAAIGVGKINDIFAGSGVTESIPTHLMTTIRSLTSSAWLRSCSTMTTPIPDSRFSFRTSRIVSSWWEMSR